MWDEERACYAESIEDIGHYIRSEGEKRQGAPRGHADSFSHILDGWDFDLSNAQRALPLCDIMSILLSIPEHKAPGTTGVRGRLYKLHANVLSPVFQEAFDDLAAGGAAAPAHLTDFIWLALPKQQGADSIKLVRDLELPNEDAKVLGRMFSKILDDARASQLRRFQQAFVSGGQIE